MAGQGFLADTRTITLPLLGSSCKCDTRQFGHFCEKEDTPAVLGGPPNHRPLLHQLGQQRERGNLNGASLLKTICVHELGVHRDLECVCGSSQLLKVFE
jgi:hypothetical protein